MALSIDKVFRFVQFVSNKESRGWIAPEQFNLAAELAQLTLYSEKEAEYAETKKISVDMRPFLKTNSGTIAAGVVPFSGAPLTDFRLPISARLVTGGTTVREMAENEADFIINSEIIPPTASYPRALYRNDGAYIYPTTLSGDVSFTYLSEPTVPTWAYTVVSNRPVYASGSSTDFEFNEPMFLAIVSRILGHVGMNLKDTELAKYSVAFEEKGQ
jgi:hypothetical protein